ncbi:hypothetical protein COR50_20380 [Chitinophaga caeni]|uniref:Outer membrane protein beta-barrel domain-containing protein n=1 Tax=Chitinophaga caeni TaxID=2029983 RepID=A0A291QZS3_9BACT|nr:TonB-dependent receptor [Chitinophaga caeni]ATL49343.1 hypothetical protein COR50_20380 [Chitinophaga caeni]
MKRITLLFTFLITFSCLANAQSVIKGVLQDKTDSTRLIGATVRLTKPGDTTFIRNLLTNTSGGFEFASIQPGSYKLTFTFLGYSELVRNISFNGTNGNMGVVNIPRSVTDLKGVTIKGQEPPTQLKGDTTQYNASAYKTNPDASAEDLVKKMPGITVQNGTVTAHGETVKKVLVDGKEYFGEDATATLKNLPAEVISKIEVFDKMSDQAQFSGFDDGNSYKAINVVTKNGLSNSKFGKVYAGYGTQGLYNAGGSVNFFNGDRRIGLIGMTNNVNQQNFASEDVLGISGGGGGRGGRGGRGGGNNFNVGSQSGINKTNSLGINFQDTWGKKLTVNGSYLFNNKSTENETLTHQVYPNDIADSVRVYNELANSETKNYNHRVNLRLEYKISDKDILMFTPSVSFQKNDAMSHTLGDFKYGDSSLINATDIASTNNNKGYNANTNLLWRHAFDKRGRTFSINFGFRANNRDGESILPSYTTTNYKGGLVTDSTLRETYSNTDGQTYSANFSYTEPVGKGQLEINYRPSISINNADQKAYTIDSTHSELTFDPSLSNLYKNKYTVNNGGLSYRMGNRDKMLIIGVNLQHATLEGDRTFPTDFNLKRSFTNVLPNLMWRQKFNKNSSVRLFYRASTDQPSINNLQDVLSYTNPLFVSTGNPELDQSYSQSLRGGYHYIDTEKGLMFIAGVNVENTNNRVTNRTYIAQQDTVLTPTFTLRKGGQLTKPINVDGYWNARSFFNLGLPLKVIKSNLNTNLGISYTRSPGYVNSTYNVSNTYAYNAGAVISSNISEYVDFTLSYNASFNNVKNNVSTLNNSSYFNGSASANVNLMTKNGWVLNSDLTNQYYSALDNGQSTNYWLWNLSAAKKFLKDNRGELRATVYDLLNQNQSISRSTTELYIEDQRSLVLKQYFMLTFTYRIKSWNKKGTDPEEEMQNDRERMFRRFGPPGGGRPGGPPPGGG